MAILLVLGTAILAALIAIYLKVREGVAILAELNLWLQRRG